MTKLLKKKVFTLLTYLVIFLASGFLVNACNSQQSANSAKTITIGISPWPGYSSHWIATAKDLFKAEGITVKEVAFASQTDSDTAFLAGKVDLNWTGLPNAIPQISRDTSVQVVMQCDYSNGADGIIGRDINKPEDLKGQKVARENILIEELLLRKYLEKVGLSRNDVTTLDMAAADAATAFSANRVNVAVTYEPWMSKAAKEGKGKIIFTSKDSNIIPDGIVARRDFIEKHQPEVLSYLRALDKAIKIVKEKPTEVTSIIAKKLGVPASEVPAQLSGVKLYDLQANREITFNPSNPMNLFDSLGFANKTAKDMDLIPQVIDVKAALNESVIKAS